MLDTLEQVAALAWTAGRKSLDTFLLPSACLPGHAIVCRDGSLVTVLELAGSRTAMGGEELERFVTLAGERLNTLFLQPGHAMHVVFERAPDRAAAVVEETIRRQTRQARSLGLDLDDVLARRGPHLAPLVADETVAVALWTRPRVLGVDQLRRDRRTMRERLRRWRPAPAAAQCEHVAFDSLPARHEALVDGAEGVFAEAGLVATRLDGGEALALLRRMVNGAAGEAPGWRPVDVGNAAPPRVTEPGHDGAHPPPLAPQLLLGPAERRGGFVALGDRLWAPLDMLLGPRLPRPFRALMERIAEAGLPCRLSMLVEGGGLDSPAAALGRAAASFLAFSSDDTLLRRNAVRELVERRNAGRAIVRLRLGLLTWTDRDGDPAQLARRLARLQQVAEGWGEMVLTPVVGDPLEAVVASVPAFCCAATGEAAAAPLTEALGLLPVSRPAPPARDRPNHVFRSADGKALPISFEGAEDYRFDLIYGRPGGGKSVLMNTLALAFALRSGVDRLPLVAIVDVGPSSSGLISLLRSALPRERRHEAGWFELHMTADCAINPFDTPLGCRRPPPAERAFLLNLLSLMLTAPGEEGPRDGMREAVMPAVDAAYALRSDAAAGGDPARYTRGRDAAVDAALDRLDVRLDDEPVWWEAVDALFAAGDVAAAARAQRYAVPTAHDLITAVREESVQALVGRAAFGDGGEPVTDAFVRMITALSAVWPALFRATAMDFGEVRVAAIDVGPAAAARGSAEADRQAAAVYMLARHALTRGWWQSPEDLSSAPPQYRDWHRARAREIAETPKRIAFDEFHRTAGVAAVRAQVERDVREGRKHRVNVCLASQRLEDFDAALRELATHYWVLGAGGGKEGEIRELGEVFGLGATAIDTVRHRLTGPGRNGAPALLIGTEEGARAEQLVFNSPPPAELWALTTATRDVALRRRLYERLGPAAARRVLAREFPAGSAVERITALLGGREEWDEDDATEAAVLDRLADELAGAPVAGAEGDAACS